MFLSRLFKKEMPEVNYGNMPAHIAIIMDGNGRWAKKRGLTRSIGHREGSSTLKKITGFCDDIGIKYLTVYAFSTENWKRPKKEVDTLMNLLMNYLKNAEKEMEGRNVRIRIIGDLDGLPPELRAEANRVVKSTAANTGLTLNIALNYGGRADILHSVKSIITDIQTGKLKAEEVNEETISQNLYTAGMPEPDLLIRTSGESRISNFLLWQSAYTEFWFTDILWPDFRKEHILEAIKTFQNRDRRFGGVKS